MKDVFERLRLSETQAKLYQLLLELGPSIASILAKRARLKRVTVYGALEGLVQKGLVEAFQRNSVTYYQASDPEVIGNLLDLELENLQKSIRHAKRKIEELKKLKEKRSADIIELKGVVRYYEGPEAIKSLIYENLKMNEKTQYCVGLSGYHALKSFHEWQSYIQARVKTGMKVYSLQADTEEARVYKNHDEAELRETRLIPPQKCPDHGELNIIGDHIILYTIEGNEAVGVQIIHKRLAKILKKLFELAWERGETIQSLR